MMFMISWRNLAKLIAKKLFVMDALQIALVTV